MSLILSNRIKGFLKAVSSELMNLSNSGMRLDRFESSREQEVGAGVTSNSDSRFSITI